MKTFKNLREGGLWANIHAKRQRIKAGSGERMRAPGEKGAPTPDQLRRAANEAVSTSYNKPDEQTGVMSYHDLEAHIGRPKALLIAKHEQFRKHMSPQMSLGAQVGFKFERRHGFESVYAVHGPNRHVDKEKPGYRTMLRFHLSGSGKKVTQVDRSVNHNNERHREGSLVWDHRETWEHPVNKREDKQIAKRLAKSDTNENFQDGRNPQDRGDSARHGIPKKASLAVLKKIRSSSNSSPRKKQLAHWQINMRQGRKD